MEYVLAALGVIIIILLLWLITRSGKPIVGDNTQGLVLLQQKVEKLSDTVDSKLSESSRQMERTLSESQRLIKDITTEIVSIKEIGTQTGQFAEQLRSFQDVLSNPKKRGIFGEYILEQVLHDVLGAKSYEMQYGFRDGLRVDAIIRLDGQIVPIDSKFPLDNYNKLATATTAERPALEQAFIADLKARIDETARYVRPEEGTLNFAFMFIPAEGIYYDLLTNRVGADLETNLIRQAAQKKVIIVSPTSFFAYLQTVLQGLKALKIERKAEQIQGRVVELGRHIGAWEESYRKLGKTLGTTVNHYNDGYKELAKIDKDVLNLSDEGIGIDMQLLSRPSDDTPP